MNRFRYCRLRAGLTQIEVAKRAGISQPALARIESARVVPRLDMAERILRACGMTLEAVPIAGQGIDRSMIRRMLKFTPRQRLALAAKEAQNLSKLR